MKKILSMLTGFVWLFSIAACGNQIEVQPVNENGVSEQVEVSVTDSLALEEHTNDVDTEENTEKNTEERTAMTMNVQIGDTVFTAELEENEAVSSLVEMMETAPVVILMSDYSGFEKVGALGTSLPASNSQTTTRSGDIVLYNGNQIVIFYGSNSWSYTRLGKIRDLTGWEDALGDGDVTVTFSLE